MKSLGKFKTIFRPFWVLKIARVPPTSSGKSNGKFNWKNKISEGENFRFFETIFWGVLGDVDLFGGSSSVVCKSFRKS